MNKRLAFGMLAVCCFGALFVAILHFRGTIFRRPAIATPVLLWDFTTPHKTGKVVVPAGVRRQISAAVKRQGDSSDEVSIFSVAEGRFTEGGQERQKVYTTWQFGRSMAEHISFFALYTNGKLKLIPNQYDGTVLRTVRLPGADVDYLVLDTEGGNNGDNVDYMRVVSLRDGQLPKIIADVGIASDDFCASEAPSAHWVASKVSYRPAGTSMEIMPFEQYSQRCGANDKLRYLKSTQDDAQKVLLALMDSDNPHTPPLNGTGTTTTAVPSQPDPVVNVDQDEANTRPAVLSKYASQLTVIDGRRFKVPEGVSVQILQEMIHEIGQKNFVSLVPFYETMMGMDGTTTLQAVSKLNNLYVGKYYMLQGDVFQIQADRDYPREGLNSFSAFGQVHLLEDSYIPVNVDLSSTERVPPYRVAAILGKITGFSLGENRAGRQIVVPDVRVMAVASPSSCCGYPDEIIINEQ